MHPLVCQRRLFESFIFSSTICRYHATQRWSRTCCRSSEACNLPFICPLYCAHSVSGTTTSASKGSKTTSLGAHLLLIFARPCLAQTSKMQTLQSLLRIGESSAMAFSLDPRSQKVRKKKGRHSTDEIFSLCAIRAVSLTLSSSFRRVCAQILNDVTRLILMFVDWANNDNFPPFEQTPATPRYNYLLLSLIIPQY